MTPEEVLPLLQDPTTPIPQMIVGMFLMPKMVKMTPQKRNSKKQITMIVILLILLVKIMTPASIIVFLIVKTGLYMDYLVKSLWIQKIQKDVLNVMKNSVIILLLNITTKMFT